MKKNWILPFIFAQAVLLGAAEPPSRRTPEERLWRDIGLSARADLSSPKTQELLNRFLKEYPSHPKAPAARYSLAERDFKAGNFQAAAAKFESFLADVPRHELADSAAFRLGECYYNLKVYNSAYAAWETVVQKHGDSALAPEALAYLSVLRMRLKEWGRADEVMKDLARRHPHYLAANPQHRENAGLILYQLGDYMESAKALEGLEAEKAAFYRGLSLFALKLYDDAVASLKLLEFNQKGLYAESSGFLKGEGFFQRKNFSLAAAEFKAFMARYPASKLKPYALLRVAACALLVKDAQDAQDAAEQALRLSPPPDAEAHALFIKACALLDKKDYAGASAFFARVSEKGDFPELAAAALLRRAWADRNRRAMDGFSSSLEALAKQYPSSSQGALSQFLLGARAFEQEKWEEAGGLFESALIRYPYNVLSEAELALMAVAYTRAGRQDQLVTAANAALKLFEGNYSSASPHWRAQSHFFVGKAYYDLRKYDQAAPFFEKVVTDHSDHALAPAAQLLLAWCHLDAGRQAKAVELAGKLLENKKLESRLAVPARFLRAVAPFNAKDYDKAIPALADFVKTNPASALAPEARYLIGLSYHQKKVFGSAIEEWNKCIAAHPDHDLAKEAHLQIGDLYFKAGKYDEAAKFFKKFHERWPSDPFYSQTALWQEIQSYFNGALDEAAVKAYPLYIRKYPDAENVEDAEKQLEMVYYRRGEQGDPEKLLEFLAKYPKSPFAPTARFKLGSMAMEQKKFNRAVQEFEQFVRDYSKDPMALEALYALGQAYESLDQPDKAVVQYREIMTQFSQKPTAVDAAFRLGMMHFNKERYKEALEAFLFAVQKKLADDTRANLLYNIALCHENLGQPEEAADAYVKFAGVSKNPEQTREALLTAGLLLKKAEKLQEAASVFSRLLKDPGSPQEALQAVNLIAESQRAAGQTQKAIQTYERLAGMEPAASDLRLAGLAQLAFLYEQGQKPKDALRVYEKIAASGGKPEWVKAAEQRVQILDKQINPVP